MNNNRVEWLSATIGRHKEINFFLVILFLVTTLSLFSALMPALDIDADGSSATSMSEGVLFASVVPTSIVPLYLSIRFASIPLASAWLLSFLLTSHLLQLYKFSVASASVPSRIA